MEWSIKKFSDLTLDEMYDSLYLRTEVFVVEQKCCYQEVDNSDKVSYHIFAKDSEGTIVAYARILPAGISFDEVSIGRVVVDKNYRGQGLSRELVKRTLDFIKNEFNEKVIQISAQEYLINFYKSFGFEINSDVYLEDNIPHIDMILQF